MRQALLAFPRGDFQEVDATLIADASHPSAPPTIVRFSATLSTAAPVSYDPASCPELATANAVTVQQAIDALCKRNTGGCTVTVGKGGDFDHLDDAIMKLLNQASDSIDMDICICLLPGDHILKDGLNIQDEKKRQVHVKIHGCGRGSRIFLQKKPWIAVGLTSFILRDVDVVANEPETFINFDRCADITVEGCALLQENQVKPFITIDHARRILFEGNVVDAVLPIEKNPASPALVFADMAPDVAELYKITDRFEFDAKSFGIASALAGLSATNRKGLIRRLQARLQQLGNMTAGEVVSYNDFIATLSVQPVDESQLRVSLADIRLARLESSACHGDRLYGRRGRCYQLVWCAR